MKIGLIFGSACLASCFVFGDTTNIIPSVTVASIPTISVQVIFFPYFGDVVAATLPNSVTLNRDNSCQASGGATSCTDPVSGVIQLTNNTGVSVQLQGINVDANSWNLTPSGQITLNIGNNNDTDRFCQLQEGLCSFLPTPLGTCSDTLAASSSCVLYIGGQLNDVSVDPGHYETNVITATLTYV